MPKIMTNIKKPICFRTQLIAGRKQEKRSKTIYHRHGQSKKRLWNVPVPQDIRISNSVKSFKAGDEVHTKRKGIMKSRMSFMLGILLRAQYEKR